MGQDFSPHQQKIIKRYYNNLEQIQLQRLAEAVTELYLAEGKKREKVWATIAAAMEKLEIPQQRRDHLMAKRDPTLLATLVKELQG